MSAKASGSDGNSGSAQNRSHHDGSAGRAYTVDQKAAVLRVRRCSPTAFYDILGLESVKTTCSEGEIKKAYRKLSLLTHPDKNGYDGADEAFKMVARAFQILSDPDKKSKFDRFGGDPESRTASAPSGFGGGGFAGRPGGAGSSMFDDGPEISPEELFRQFFGGGMGGGGGFPFGTSRRNDCPSASAPCANSDHRRLRYWSPIRFQHGRPRRYSRDTFRPGRSAATSTRSR